MDTEKFIAAVKQAQTDQALEGFLRPKQRDAFEYGLLAGYAQGLEKSLSILQSIQDDVDGKTVGQPTVSSNPYAEGVDVE